MSGNWWVSKSGKNALLTLPEWLVLDLLYRHPNARRDFQTLVPTIEDDDEKERLQALWDDNRRVHQRPLRDPQEVTDALQARHNRAGVRTRKPKKRKR